MVNDGGCSSIRRSTRAWTSTTSSAPYARDSRSRRPISNDFQMVPSHSGSAPVKTTIRDGMNVRKALATVRLRRVSRISSVIASTRMTRPPGESVFVRQNVEAAAQNVAKSLGAGTAPF